MGIRIKELAEIDFSDIEIEGKLPPVTPGEILLEDFLKPMGLSQYRLANEIGVPQRRIGEIVAGKSAITIDTGLRLARFFGINGRFWVGLQTDYDTLREKEVLAEVLSRIQPIQMHAH